MTGTGEQPLDGAFVATAAQLACLLEASARKPGNVSPAARFDDIGYEHFLASAAAIGPAFGRVATQSLGATIRGAVEATARWVPSNTNLGVVLLLAPLAHAAVDGHGGPLDARVERVLTATTVADAADIYAAIRLARPGGLGQTDREDVAAEPTVTLRAAMALAAGRDSIAREYTTGFRLTFGLGVPALARARAERMGWDDAVVTCYLALLAAEPDTHVARKLGASAAKEVMTRARGAQQAGGVRSEGGRRALAELDAALRGSHNVRNPGTTADLTAAAIFALLLGGGWTHTGDRNHAGS